LVRFSLEVGEEAATLVGVEPLLLLQDFDVRLQARDRRAKLVRCVGDEPALCLDRLLEGGKHGVEGRAEARELVTARGLLHTLAGIPRLRDAFRRTGQAPHGNEGRPRDESAACRAGRYAARDDE